MSRVAVAADEPGGPLRKHQRIITGLKAALDVLTFAPRPPADDGPSQAQGGAP